MVKHLDERAVEEESEDEEIPEQDPYFSSYSHEYQLTAGQTWSRKPWMSLFKRFIRRGCSAQVHGVPVCCACTFFWAG